MATIRLDIEITNFNASVAPASFNIKLHLSQLALKKLLFAGFKHFGHNPKFIVISLSTHNAYGMGAALAASSPKGDYAHFC
jgi:hypothetical protein